MGGGIRACLAAGLQGVVVSQQACRFPGPHPGGKFRGMASGQGGLQAHTGGGGEVEGGSGRGGLQAHTWGGVCSWGEGAWFQGGGWGGDAPPGTATTAGGMHPGMHSCLIFAVTRCMAH